MAALPATAARSANPSNNPPSGLGVTPVFVDTGGQSNDCLLFGAPASSEYSFRIANPKSQAYAGQLPDGTSFTVTLSIAANGVRKDKFFDFAITGGVVASDVGVKGGSQTARYNYLGTPTFAAVAADTALHATFDNQGNLYNLSNVTLCLTKAPVRATISGRVFGDDDGNGAFNGSESGLSTTVNVYPAAGGPSIATATTGAGGVYTVSDPDVLTGASYKVCAVAPTGASWLQTLPTGLPNCGSFEFGVGPVVALSGNTTGIDIGAQKQASITGVAFNDANNNGINDGGAELAAGWTVRLYNGTSSVSTTTDANGAYSFTGKPAASSYTVCVVPPAVTGTWTQTAPVGAAATGTCSGTGELTGGYGFAPLASDRTGANFGAVVLANISGAVFYDTNSSGTKDSGEQGLAWTVKLYSGATEKSSTTADANGAYAFNGLVLGTYRVCVVSTAGTWRQTVPPAGSPACGGTGELPLGRSITLGGGGSINQSFGNVQIASISGLVFNDADVSGSFTPGSTPADTVATGKTVNLYRAPSLTDTSIWTFVKAATTNANGAYTLDADLGQYAVCLASISNTGETQPIADPDTTGSLYCAGGAPGGSGGPDFYRGYGVQLTAAGSSNRDFGITPTVPCTTPVSVPGYEIHLASCKPGQSFVVAYQDDATKLASVQPIRTDLAPVGMTEKITWTLTPPRLRQFTLLYDDTVPFGDATSEMPYCNLDPRIAGSEFNLQLTYRNPANAGAVIPSWPAGGYPSSPSNPGNTSCIIDEQTNLVGSSDGEYVVHVYSAIDGWRSTP